MWTKVDPMKVAHIDAFHRDTAGFWEYYRPRFEGLGDKRPTPRTRRSPSSSAAACWRAWSPRTSTGCTAPPARRTSSRSTARSPPPAAPAAARPMSSSRSSALFEDDGVATCGGCMGKVKPDVVLFGEHLPVEAMAEAPGLCAGRRPAALRRVLARGLPGRRAARADARQRRRSLRSSPRARPRTTPTRRCASTATSSTSSARSSRRSSALLRRGSAGGAARARRAPASRPPRRRARPRARPPAPRWPPPRARAAAPPAPPGPRPAGRPGRRRSSRRRRALGGPGRLHLGQQRLEPDPQLQRRLAGAPAVEVRAGAQQQRLAGVRGARAGPAWPPGAPAGAGPRRGRVRPGAGGTSIASLQLAVGELVAGPAADPGRPGPSPRGRRRRRGPGSRAGGRAAPG